MDCPHSALHKTPYSFDQTSNLQVVATSGNGGEPPKFEKKFKNEFFENEFFKTENSLKNYSFSERKISEKELLTLKIATFIIGETNHLPGVSPDEPNLMESHSAAVKLVLKSLIKPAELQFLCASKFDKTSHVINLTRDVVHYTLELSHPHVNFKNFRFTIQKDFLPKISLSVEDFRLKQVQLLIDTDHYNKKLNSNSREEKSCTIL